MLYSCCISLSQQAHAACARVLQTLCVISPYPFSPCQQISSLLKRTSTSPWLLRTPTAVWSWSGITSRWISENLTISQVWGRGVFFCFVFLMKINWLKQCFSAALVQQKIPQSSSYYDLYFFLYCESQICLISLLIEHNSNHIWLTVDEVINSPSRQHCIGSYWNIQCLMWAWPKLDLLF